MNEPSPLSGPEKWFNREHLDHDLKGKSVRGGARTVGAQLISFAINIGTTIFLARLLLPEDYGLVAMVTSFTGFILMFKDLGLAQAIIQAKELNQKLVSMSFWFNVIMSILLAGIIIALGPVLVWFYDEPLLLGITLYYSLVAILGGISTQHQALLSRQMRFRELANITIAASFFSLIPALWMAWAGYGYWALVAVNVLNGAISALLLWLYCDWRPNFVKIDRSIKHIVGFGAGVSGFNMVNYFSRNFDNVLIGRYVGSDALGLYSKAYQILMLPISQIRDPLNTVGIPALSSLTGKPDRYRSYYKQYLFLLSFFSMPVIVFLFITSSDIILFLLGENWMGAALIFQLLAITAFIQPAASTRGMVMISCGLSKRFFFGGVYNAVFVTAGFAIGLYLGGVNGLVIAYAIVNYLILIPSLIYSFKDTPVTVADFFNTVAAPAVISLLAGLVLYLAAVYAPEWPLWALIAGYGITFLLVYALLWIVVPAQRRKLYGVVELTKSLRNK